MKKLNWKIAPALLIGALLVPALSAVQTAEAKPKDQAPAYGYRSNEDRKDERKYDKNRRKETRKYDKERRKDERQYRRDSRDNDNRRYRTRYRTRYDREGNPFREYFRVYY